MKILTLLMLVLTLIGCGNGLPGAYISKATYFCTCRGGIEYINTVNYTVRCMNTESESISGIDITAPQECNKDSKED